jgi:hypothetical protein
MKYAIAAALFLPLAAGANDGIGVVAAGGIVFKKTDAVAMKKEVLTVGYRRIADVTAQLRKACLSDAQIAYGALFSDRVKVPPLGAQQRQQLTKMGLFGDERTGEPDPLWDVQFNYVWQQRFPANKVVRVHHAYRRVGPGCRRSTFKKVDATTYQVRLQNFQPTSDLDVYFGNLEDAGASEADMPRLNK